MSNERGTVYYRIEQYNAMTGEWQGHGIAGPYGRWRTDYEAVKHCYDTLAAMGGTQHRLVRQVRLPLEALHGPEKQPEQDIDLWETHFPKNDSPDS